MTPPIPEFEPPFDETEASVRSRFDTDADAILDKREGSFYQMLTEPAVKEGARIYSALNDSLQMQSPLYAFGVYLDYKAAEYGVTRKPAAKAEGEVTFTGTNGVIIPAATRVTVPGDDGEDETIRFVTDAEVTIAAGTATVAITADQAGADGNVDASAISVLEDVINGITAVDNADATSGGTDEESDDDLRDRLLLEINAPQAAGSASDYERWALSRTGVSKVTVIPVWEGANTVKVVLLGADNNPVSETIMDDVQEYLTGEAVIADPTTAPTTADGGAGALTGDFYYKVTFIDVEDCETKPGPASTLLTVAAKDIDLSSIPLGPTGTTGRRIYRSGTADGVYRLVTEIADNTTTIYTDNDADISAERVAPKTNNTTDYLGQAPIGARVSVDTPELVEIAIACNVTLESGYSLDDSGGTINLTESIESALEDYINSLSPGDDVIYMHVASTFFDVEGMFDFATLTVEGGTSNVTITDSEVATLGTVTLS